MAPLVAQVSLYRQREVLAALASDIANDIRWHKVGRGYPITPFHQYRRAPLAGALNYGLGGEPSGGTRVLSFTGERRPKLTLVCVKWLHPQAAGVGWGIPWIRIHSPPVS